MVTARTVMVQGTTSDAGKSLLTAALCRWLRRRNVRVAPFKPQNMSLNSAVTADGGEIGRAQAAQAAACGLAPHTDMNPVLLKPCTDTGAQVIIHGRARRDMEAGEYHDFKPRARTAVLASHKRLAARYDAIVAEGAGSPAEINLRAGDIANMGFAEAVDCPVLLVADIDRGGVFAHIVGTLALLSPGERRRVRGFVINKFRGDPTLLTSGLDWLERETRKPVLGVLPYLPDLDLEAEDALPVADGPVREKMFRVVVPALPRLSNHTDFDPLRRHPAVDLRFAGPGEPPRPADLVILPGSKNVRADLEWLRSRGWVRALERHLRYGGKIIGICGGFQMLGRRVADPRGIESVPGTSDGFGWLNMETILEPKKILRRRRGRLVAGGAEVVGYEIHAGISRGKALDRPAVRWEKGGTDGAMSADDQILGTYLHGLFDEPGAARSLLSWAGLPDAAGAVDMSDRRERTYDRLADAVERHLDTALLANLFGLSGGASCGR